MEKSSWKNGRTDEQNDVYALWRKTRKEWIKYAFTMQPLCGKNYLMIRLIPISVSFLNKINSIDAGKTTTNSVWGKKNGRFSFDMRLPNWFCCQRLILYHEFFNDDRDVGDVDDDEDEDVVEISLLVALCFFFCSHLIFNLMDSQRYI